MNPLTFPLYFSGDPSRNPGASHLRRRLSVVAGLLSLACAAPSTALAEPPPGQLLASQCAQCHGTNGTGYESIAGEDHFRDLIEMKYGRVGNIMDRHIRGYTDDQLRLIADYLRSLPGGGDD